MGWIIPIAALLVVAAFLAFKNKDKLAGLLKKEPKPALGADLPPSAPAVVVPFPTAVQQPQTVTVSKYDYARWGAFTPYDLQMKAGQADGPFPRGVPPDWDWKEWARVNGKVDPTAKPDTGQGRERPSGFMLIAGAEPVVNTLSPDQEYVYSFTVDGRTELGWSPQGSGGNLTAWITQARDGPVLHSVSQMVNAGEIYFPAVAEEKATGGYFLHLKLDRGPFVVGVQQVNL